MANLQVTRQDHWRQDVLAWREEKDRFFAAASESPLRPEDRSGFRGLAYYPVSASWRLRATFRRLPAATPLRLVASRGISPNEYVAYAEAEFDLPSGAQERVTLYAPRHDHQGHAPHEPDELFLPFRDGSSGDETYEAGRYLEVPNPLLDGGATGVGALDFNMAYNPYCAYNDGYVCPLPPKANWLRSHIRAGERLAAAE